MTTLVREWIRDRLEAGTFNRIGGVLAQRVARSCDRTIARPLLTSGAFTVVTVGGSTLGGSGKTRVALAIARWLADRGVQSMLVGHAYRAKPTVARLVGAHDPLGLVGDEAIVCARALAGTSARVIVGPSRQDAFDLAARWMPATIVIDGPVQLRPRRADVAVLALDARRPWGTGACPPAGDLRASPEALLAHSDVAVHVDAAPDWFVGGFGDGPRRSLSDLPPRCGLFTAVARPARLLEGLARRGVRPLRVVSIADHGGGGGTVGRRLRGGGVDVWLATAKCALHLEQRGFRGDVAVLDGHVPLPPTLTSMLQAAAP